MIHIIKNSDGTFDQVTVRSGKLIQRSNQGYENKLDLVDTIIADLQEVRCPSVGHCYRIIQDDTPRSAKVIKVWSNGQLETLDRKPGKKYRPK